MASRYAAVPSLILTNGAVKTGESTQFVCTECESDQFVSSSPTINIRVLHIHLLGLVFSLYGLVPVCAHTYPSLGVSCPGETCMDFSALSKSLFHSCPSLSISSYNWSTEGEFRKHVCVRSCSVSSTEIYLALITTDSYETHLNLYASVNF